MIDIGANLAHESFQQDFEAVLARAAAAGITHIVLTGSDADSNSHALQRARSQPETLSATAGLHPHHAAAWSDVLAAQIRTNAQAPECRAIGECGLDYFRDLAPRASQRDAFRAQLDIAVETALPVFLHQRDAHDDFLAILSEYRPHLIAACVHCFSEGPAALADYLALDCYIGMTGWVCDERRGAAAAEAAPAIPTERLMIETDAPYLLPRNLPRAVAKSAGRRNEPAYLPWVRDRLAALRNESPEDLGNAAAVTARRFFGIPAIPEQN